MNPSYNAMMSLLGMESIKQLVKKWDTLSDNLRGTALPPALIVPDLFWVMNPGVGRTNLLQLLSEYLCSKGNLLDFYGNVKYFEFLLNYVFPEQSFQELQRLVDTAQNAAGFRNEFRGIVCIDISEWITHFREKHFVSFLEFLASHSEDWLIILAAQKSEPQKIDALYTQLSLFLRLERVDLSLPNDDALVEYIGQKLSSYGLLLQEGAEAVLLQTVCLLRKNRGFDGFKTLDMLCQDIAYAHLCSPGASTGCIPNRVVQEFAPDSPYVCRLIQKIEHKLRIGFNAEELKDA